jgi:hypothetical protein
MIKKGEEIVCEHGHTIGTALIDIKHGDEINAYDFDWQQKKYKNGEEQEPCNICGLTWWQNRDTGRAALLTRRKYEEIKF